MGFIGMDVPTIRQVGRDLETQAQNLRGIVTMVDRIDRRARQSWRGPDCDRLHHEWTGQYRAMISNLALEVEALGRKALANADEQDQTSDSFAGGGSADQGGGGSGGGGSDGHPTYVQTSGSGQFGPLSYSGEAGAGAQTSAHASGSQVGDTLQGSADAGAKAGAWASGAAAVGGPLLGAKVAGQAFAGASADAGASGEIGPDGASGQASANAFAGAKVNADGNVDVGPVGISGNANAMAGASADGSASGTVRWNQVSGAFDGDVFAGARAGASNTVTVLGLASTENASVEAGIGAHASGDAAIGYDEVHVGFDVGVCLGIGGDVGYDASFSPKDMVDSVTGTVGGIISGGSSVVKGIDSLF